FHINEGRNVVQGDASDTDFWEKLDRAPNLELVLLTMPHHVGNLFAVEQLKLHDYQGKLSAIVKYKEDAQSLSESGVHSVYNLYEAAGAGLVEHLVKELLTPGGAAPDNPDAINRKNEADNPDAGDIIKHENQAESVEMSQNS
ncbi:NAD-binding protein, partial [Shewanella sp. 0m-11]